MQATRAGKYIIVICVAMQSLSPLPGICAVNDEDCSAIGTLRKTIADIGALQPPVPVPGAAIPATTGKMSEDKGIDINITIALLHELGNSPDEKETKKIKSALDALKNSKIGPEICNSVGKVNQLTFPPETGPVESC
jgi:hypothetical protein